VNYVAWELGQKNVAIDSEEGKKKKKKEER
jgi:hypothetical protein